MYIDNQAVIKALLGAKPSSGQHLITVIRLEANATLSRLAIKWISSHSEVKGNEAADKLTKAAAQGQSSRMVDLPHILRTPLLASASATKQSYHAKLNKLWVAHLEKTDFFRSTLISHLKDSTKSCLC